MEIATEPLFTQLTEFDRSKLRELERQLDKASELFIRAYYLDDKHPHKRSTHAKARDCLACAKGIIWAFNIAKGVHEVRDQEPQQ